MSITNWLRTLNNRRLSDGTSTFVQRFAVGVRIWLRGRQFCVAETKTVRENFYSEEVNWALPFIYR